MRIGSLIVLAAFVAAGPQVLGQDADGPQLSPEEKLAAEGKAEVLDQRLNGGRNPKELGLLARAYRNRARSMRKADDRREAFGEAQRRYQKWISAVERDSLQQPEKHAVDLAAARFEYAGMILSLWIAGDLDQFEITLGQKGDRPRLLELLKEARAQYEKILAAISPLYEERHRREDEFLAMGIFDAVRQLKLDGTISMAWTDYYVAVVGPDDAPGRKEALADAEKKFQQLLDSGEAGEAVYQCYLGLAMALREQQRYDEAQRNFGLALQGGADVALEAQARYELARCQMRSGKFEEARTTLAPLVEKDVENLRAEDRPAAFYINLSQLWDANSYLLEANAIRNAAGSGAGQRAVLRQAERTRERGLAKMNGLRARGGPWPAIVQLYVASSIDTNADPQSLAPSELLSLASQLTDARKLEDAEKLLEEAAARSGTEPALAAEVLFELGKVRYLLKNERAAAALFQRVAREYREQEQASQAISFAVQLWGKLANESKSKADFGKFADVLTNLLADFPDAERRDEAVWWLPLALQSAGRYEEAARRYADVPEGSPHREEAQFRRELCGRLEAEARRDQLSTDAYLARVRSVAGHLLQYADAARQRAAEGGAAAETMNFAAEARVNAAEMLVSGGSDQFHQALQSVENFEQLHPDSELTGRVLAVRIRAYRGLKDYENAAKILDEYLATVPPEKAGQVLASLARGMQDEVERLLDDGQAEAAKVLAGEAVDIFRQLEKWFLADEQRAKGAEAVQVGLARLLYIAGQTEDAEQIVDTLLAKNPRNGNLQRLQALVLNDRLQPDSPPAQVEKVRDAWATLLRDATLRTRAPERYWEARYNWLSAMLRLGNAADVETAIRQERVWYPELGGSPWKEKFEALYAEAAAQAGTPAPGGGAQADAPEGAAP